ncbi:methyl-accepting chemotaxis protein [Desulfovibrio ferrophilus]|uniref:Sensory box protein n=1 Tax=Desulfovibrio ferrophilus TaxID=241368 RepID=A0A2Z6AXY9_9BACT|nr:methyl-accepting chemotaxis protein [Desulfovibrio ferrophilus]BBD08109.1 sensory box protein [Desulfovibrio ferrophilus]
MINSIKSHLILGFSSLCAISLAIALFGFIEIKSIGESADVLTTRCTQLIISVKNLEIQALQLRIHEKEYAQNVKSPTTRAQSKQYFNQTMQALLKDLDYAEPLAASLNVVSTEQRQQFREIRVRFENYHNHFLSISQQLAANGTTGDIAIQQLFAPLDKDIESIIEALDKAKIDIAILDSTVDQLNAQNQHAMFVFAALTLAALLVALLALTLTLKAVGRPVKHIVSLASQVAGGDLNARNEEAMPREMMLIRSALEQMVHELKFRIGSAEGVLDNLPMPFLMVDAKERVVRTNQACLDMLELDGPVQAQYGLKLGEVFYNDPTRQTAVGKSIHHGEKFVNLSVQIAGHKGGSLDVLANVFPLHDLDGECIGGVCIYLDMTANKQQERQIIEQNQAITRTAEQAGRISMETAAAAEELSAQIEQTSRGAEQQSQRTQEAATALEQMSASVIEIARNSGLSAEYAKEASAKAQSGRDSMEVTLTSMTRLSEQSAELKTSLTNLGVQAESIGSVMDVISDIADQTNLLALNAAIEAARAGDAGRGFAVVADEVRKLAEKTTIATKEVGDAVGRIQQETNHNIQAMEDTLTSINESSGYAEQAGSALREIVDIVGTTTEQILSIAAASEEQSAAVEEISHSMEDINGISGESANSMVQASQAVMELSQLTHDLNTVIDGLRS